MKYHAPEWMANGSVHLDEERFECVQCRRRTKEKHKPGWRGKLPSFRYVCFGKFHLRVPLATVGLTIHIWRLHIPIGLSTHGILNRIVDKHYDKILKKYREGR